MASTPRLCQAVDAVLSGASSPADEIARLLSRLCSENSNEVRPDGILGCSNPSPRPFPGRQLKKLGAKGSQWDGARDYQARNNMRAMEVGDLGFYHSQSGLDIVGIVRVIAPADAERGSDDPRWECVDVRAETAMPQPVTLAAIKDNRKLAEMALVKNSRLSVQPVRHDEWVEVCRMGGLAPAPASKE